MTHEWLMFRLVLLFLMAGGLLLAALVSAMLASRQRRAMAGPSEQLPADRVIAVLS